MTWLVIVVVPAVSLEYFVDLCLECLFLWVICFFPILVFRLLCWRFGRCIRRLGSEFFATLLRCGRSIACRICSVEFLADAVLQVCECEAIHDIPHVGWVVFLIHCVSSFSFALNRVLALAKYSPNVSFSFMVIFLSWIPASILLLLHHNCW